MEPPPLRYKEDEYIRTSTSNLISRGAIVHGSQNVAVKGKSIIMGGAVVRGDLAKVQIGRFCAVAEGAVLHPAYVLEREQVAEGGEQQQGQQRKCRFIPLTVGSYTHIGCNSVVQAAWVGSFVRIGNDCVIGPNSVIRDNCSLEDGCVLAAGAVVPPFTVVRGTPGRLCEDMPEGTPMIHKEDAVAFFQRFVPFSQPAGGEGEAEVEDGAAVSCCWLCVDSPVVTRFRPCGCAVACRPCSQLLWGSKRGCPICQASIESVGPSDPDEDEDLFG